MVERLIDSIGHGADATPPADLDPPFLTNQIPAPSDTGVNTTTNILFRIDDNGDGVDLTSVLIEIDLGGGFVNAFTGSAFVAPFNGAGSSATPAGNAGFDFVIDGTSDMPEFSSISVRVTASDLSVSVNTLGPITYSFTTADETIPFISNRVPGPGQLSVDVATNITFTIDDVAPGTGVDSSTINASIDEGFGPVDAILLGVFQAGYSGSIVANGLGFDITINPDVDITDDVIHTMAISADDLDGNMFSTSYSFSTADPPPPPAPPAILSGLPGFPLDMYRFLIQPIPDADHLDGNLFVKRYLDGPNLVWQEIVKGLENIPNLWSVNDIADEHLKFLKNILGWTAELEGITDRLTDAGLRRLIAASGALWRERGPENAILDVLRIVSGGVRMRIWNWFDFRWIIDETELGEEHEGQDPWIIDAPSESRAPQFSAVITEPNAEYFSNLRIVDNGTLDRQLIKDVLNLMRSANERFDIIYVDFLDLFQIPGDNLQWDLDTVDFTVEAGLAKLEDTTIIETTAAIASTASTWAEYVYSAKIRGNVGTAGAFGLMFYHQDFDNTYLVSIDTATQTLSLQKRVGGTPTVITSVDLGAAEINILEDVFYTVRVEVVVEGGTNRILVFVDGSQLISDTDAQFSAGSVGLFHTTDATIQCSEVEVFELPVDSEILEINT